MRIVELSLENFRSFKGGPHVLQLGNVQPGLHFITGENRVDVELGANGAGKSTVFDAVNYALFGKTLQGITAASSVSWGAKGCAVKLRLMVSGREVVIERGREGRTNYLRLDGKEAVQDAVDRAVGLTESLFAQALVRKQFAVMFFDRAPADQLKLLTDVLDLEFWDAKSAAAKVKAKELSDAVQTAKETISHLNGKRDAALASASAAQASFDAAERQHEVDMNAANDALASKTQAVESAKASHEKACLIHSNAQQESAELWHGEAELQEEKHALNLETQKYHDERTGMVNAIAQWQSRIDYFNNLTGNCPICEQPIGAEHVQSCIQVAHDEIKAYQKNMSNVDVRISTTDGKRAAVDERIDKRRSEVNARSKAVMDLQTAANNAERVLRTAEREFDAAQQHLNTLKAWSNPHSETLSRETNEAKLLETQIKASNDDLRDCQRRQSMAEFWVDGFRRIRLFVIDRTIATMEVEVNASLASLGLVGYRIHFATEKVSKTGNVSRKFDVLVDNPAAGKESVPLAAWSGGEYQRLRLACELGVSNMILKARGIDAEFEVWDEPTTHLSVRGVESLLSALRERAYLLKRQIYIIDHVSHAFSFDSVTRVVKTDDGSRFCNA